MIEDLLSRGFSEEDARSRAALIGSVVDTFTRRVGLSPSWRFWVPGRVELFGKHTDYAGGRSLVAAVPRGFAVAARARADRLVQVIDAKRGRELTVDPANLDPVPRGWATYVTTVVGRLAMNFPDARLGTDIVVGSDLPAAAGLSSSSAFIIGVAVALTEAAGLRQRREWQQNIGTAQGLAGYLAALEAGASFGGLAGTSGVGTHGGSEDHTAILTCRPGMVSEYRYVPVRHVGDAALPGGWACVIATSGVHAAKAGGARDRFNRTADATRTLLQLWNRAAGDTATSLAAALASRPDAGQRLETWLGEMPGVVAQDLARRLAHFRREDARVPSARQAIAHGDRHAVGLLAAESQRDAETLLGNQVPETVDLVAAAREAGAFAATTFGAGFGGSAWAFVPTEEAGAFGPAWVDQYRAMCPHVTTVEWFLARPSPAMCEVLLAPMR